MYCARILNERLVLTFVTCQKSAPYLRKHCDEGVHDNFCLSQVGSGHLNENISSIDQVWSQMQCMQFSVKICHFNFTGEDILK